MRYRPHLTVAFLLITLALQAADQKQQQQYYIKPDQTADLAAETKLSTAKQNCENWAIAAGLETMLQHQNVALDQSFWIMRLNGGELCIDNPPTIDGLKLQQVTLLLWRGHPYYLTGVTYYERIGRDGTRFFGVKEIRLANTYPKLPGVTFQKGRDDPAEIQGILSVSATTL